MYKFIDGSPEEGIEGFAYQGKFGIEYVDVNNHQISIRDSEAGTADIAIVDIPKLIKALEAAYDHVTLGESEKALKFIEQNFDTKGN